jgi:hypothetical protein
MTLPLPDLHKPFWQRLSLLPHFYLLLLVVLCVVAVWRPLTGGEDFWAHAAVGRWICENRMVPHQTLFLWSAAEPWTAHPWLSQVLFYGLTAIGPDHFLATVILAFTAVLVAVPYIMAWRVAARRAPVSSWMIVPFSLAIIVNFSRYQARPELFTTLLLSCLLVFLIHWSESPAPRVWWSGVMLFLLFVAWANLHSGVVLGLIVLALTVICDLLQDRGSRRSRMLALLAMLAPIAVCVNPYFLDYWKFEPLASSRFFLFTDWYPLWRLVPVPLFELAVQGLLLALAVIAWVRNPKRRWAHAAWLLSVGALYAGAAGTSWLLTIVSLYAMAANMSGLVLEDVWQRVCLQRPQSTEARTAHVPRGLRWAVRIGLVSWLLIQIGTRVLALVQYDRAYLPVHLESGVVQFTREHALAGRMFNDFENSRYLEWCLGGEPSLFIDMQRAYPRQLLRDYLDILMVTPRGQELLLERDIGFVVLTPNRNGPSSRGLAHLLDHDVQWKRIYAGWDGIIWVRRTPQYAYLWSNPQLSPDPFPFDMLELMTREEAGPHVMFSP